MDGEFDRDCREQGGCPPILVKTQYGEIRKQLLSGVIDKQRQAVGKEFDDLWKALQAQNELPRDEEAVNVTKKLLAAELKARDDLEEHAKKENEPKFIKEKMETSKRNEGAQTSSAPSDGSYSHGLLEKHRQKSQKTKQR